MGFRAERTGAEDKQTQAGNAGNHRAASSQETIRIIGRGRTLRQSSHSIRG
jgi:hypothetical protein